MNYIINAGAEGKRYDKFRTKFVKYSPKRMLVRKIRDFGLAMNLSKAIANIVIKKYGDKVEYSFSEIEDCYQLFRVKARLLKSKNYPNSLTERIKLL